MTRDAQKQAFLQGAGWAEARITALAGDASNRRYDRLFHPDGRRAVLMDAPPDKGEDTRPFVNISTYLNRIGLSAPRLFAQDDALGFLLLEDLGDALFARVLESTPAAETSLYEAAIDTLVHLQRTVPPELPAYDAATMAPLAALAFDWYLFGVSGAENPVVKASFRALFEKALAPFDAAPRVVILRDYHTENLIWLPERQGVARVGLLDFQDALLGHPAYDLVSVLQDARRDVSPLLEAGMITRFTENAGHAPEPFRAAYAHMGAQRALRILGVFARLCLRDGKPHYVDLIPRVWGLLERNLAHPELLPVAEMLRDVLPPPDPQILNTLRSQCARHPMR